LIAADDLGVDEAVNPQGEVCKKSKRRYYAGDRDERPEDVWCGHDVLVLQRGEEMINEVNEKKAFDIYLVASYMTSTVLGMMDLTLDGCMRCCEASSVSLQVGTPVNRMLYS
jgi:hypothetical protein